MKCRRKNGFTLMEIMLALLVIAIGVIAGIALLSNSLDSSTKSHSDVNIVSFADMVFNYCHAQEDFNQLKSSSQLTLPDYAGNTVNLPIGIPSQYTGQFEDSGGQLRQTYTVTYQLDIDTPPGRPELIQLTLQIWPGSTANGTPQIFQTEIYNWKKLP